MKKTLVIALLLAASFVRGQEFAANFKLVLPDSVRNHELTFVDFDNDGILDVLLSGISNAGGQYFLFYKTDTIQGFSSKGGFHTGLKNASVMTVDYDLDNDIDIVASGLTQAAGSTQVLRNDSKFVFVSEEILSRAGTVVRFSDLNDDGSSEMLMSGVEGTEPFFSIYLRKAEEWVVVHDSLNVHAKNLEVVDFDLNGRNDLFMSGRKSDNSVFTWVLYNANNFWFKEAQTLPISESTPAVADFNSDGAFDIAIDGMLLSNQGKHFDIVNGFVQSLSSQKLFGADFNSDGKCDIHQIGNSISGHLMNQIIHPDGTRVTIGSANLQAQAFGDYDRDGDLDAVQTRMVNDVLELHAMENLTPQKNLAADRITNFISARIYNRFFMYWDKPFDDHTSSDALTYDLYLGSQNEQWTSGEYDLLTGYRMKVSHGNNGSKNYLLLRRDVRSVYFEIQTIDNAFHSGVRGTCTGSIGGLPRCEAQVTVEKIPYCKNEVITIPGTPQTMWFSFKDGFIGGAGALEIEPTQSDTIFSLTPRTQMTCASIKIYELQDTVSIVKKTFSTQYVCEGEPNTFSVGDGWQVSWSSHLKGFLSDAMSIEFATMVNDSLKATLTDNAGCVIHRNTALKVSRPVATINGDLFKIIRGSEVQLMADGGESFKWTPSLWLSNDAIATPIATPEQTIEYTVTVKDSIGCEANAKTRIIVDGAAFIPNLFTPNNDGKNDDVRIYGVDVAEDFKFTIHNRDGAIVFETTNLSDASTSGWNGTSHGTDQPAGVYFWKVKGFQPSGRKLLLNGKSSGSIVLLR